MAHILFHLCIIHHYCTLFYQVSTQLNITNLTKKYKKYSSMIYVRPKKLNSSHHNDKHDVFYNTSK